MHLRPAYSPLLVLLLVAPLAMPALAGAPPDGGADPAAPRCAGGPGADFARRVAALPAHAMGDPPLAPCPGIRPGGALVVHPLGKGVDMAYCSMAFIVTDGEDLYVATAGHCVDPAAGHGPRFSAHGVPGEFGTLAYRWCEGTDARGEGCGVGSDFALIRVDEDKRQHVSAAMCHWGAPTGGLFRGWDSELRAVQHFGWGVVVGDASANVATVGNPATQAREGLGVDFSDPGYAVLVTPATVGDSGSGVLVVPFDPEERAPLTPDERPQALGVLTHVSGGVVYAQRLDASLLRAGMALGKPLRLVTA